LHRGNLIKKLITRSVQLVPQATQYRHSRNEGARIAQHPPDTHTALGGYQHALGLALVIGLELPGWTQDPDALWGENRPQDLHELLANALVLVACIHVAAVLWVHFGLKPLLRHRMLFGGNYATNVGARDVWPRTRQGRC
jgi:cytochrome b